MIIVTRERAANIDHTKELMFPDDMARNIEIPFLCLCLRDCDPDSEVLPTEVHRVCVSRDFPRQSKRCPRCGFVFTAAVIDNDE